MGKALVVNGLEVSNPLTIVTFVNGKVLEITLDKSTEETSVGESFTLTANVVTTDGSVIDPAFSANDSSMVSISSVGNIATITALKKGNCIITASAGGRSATCSLEIKTTAAVELAEYYAANTSANDSEKSALNALVGGLINNDLWSKVKYFYPMLGDNVSDMFLDAISPSTEDFISNVGYDTARISVTNRKLTSTAGGYQGSIITPTMPRWSQIDKNNIALICSFEHGGNYAGKMFVISGYPTSATTNFWYGRMTNQKSHLNYGTDWSLEDLGKATKNISIATIKDGVASLYQKGVLQNSVEIEPISPITRFQSNYTFGVNASGASNENVYIGSFAITDGLTSSEVETFTGLLKTYLTTLGRYTE